jgi:hypothetical protein
MAGIKQVTIDSGKIEAEMPAYLVPSDKWPELLNARVWFVKERLPSDCRRLVQFVDEAADMYQSLGYKSAEDLIHSGLELQSEEIEHALGWLRLAKPEKPVTLKDATILGKHGEFGRGRPKLSDVIRGSNRTSIKRGTTSAYNLARLKRDHPEVVEQLQAGEFSSIYAAAKAAGIIKEKPLTQLKYWWKKASTAEQTAFLESIAK